MEDEEAGSGSWWQIVVAVSAADAELVADRLIGLGSPGVEERHVDDATQLIAGFPNRTVAMRAAGEIVAHDPRPTLRPVLDDGLDAWRDHARTVRTDRFTLQPAWLPSNENGDDRIRIVLDAERTFGSGSHPTTRLCLDLLAEIDMAGLRVLDVGTGSGVLAIAAALLGADAVIAIDIDPASPATVADNASRNGVGHRVDASNRPLDEIATEPPFDLVLANLLAPTIRDLAADLAATVSPDGRLIVSGLLTGQTASIGDLLVGHGLVPRASRTEDDWIALTLGRDDR